MSMLIKNDNDNKVLINIIERLKMKIQQKQQNKIYYKIKMNQLISHNNNFLCCFNLQCPKSLTIRDDDDSLGGVLNAWSAYLKSLLTYVRCIRSNLSYQAED